MGQHDFWGALRLWDKPPQGFGRPAEQLSAHDSGNGHVTDVVASQIQGTLAANVQFSSFHRPVVFGRRSEAIGQFKQVQILPRRLDAIETASG